MVAFVLGGGVALAAFFRVGAERITRIPSFTWWLCMLVGSVLSFHGMAHSTAPSFAPRIAAIGKAYNPVERKAGRDTYFGFRFLPAGGGEPVDIETSIILPGWAVPEVFDGRTFRVVYLQSSGRPLKNEAIDIEILSGRDTGFHDSVDARPAGAWLAIPLGAAIGCFGLFGVKAHKKKADRAQKALEGGDTVGS